MRWRLRNLFVLAICSNVVGGQPLNFNTQLLHTASQLRQLHDGIAVSIRGVLTTVRGMAPLLVADGPGVARTPIDRVTIRDQ